MVGELIRSDVGTAAGTGVSLVVRRYDSICIIWLWIGYENDRPEHGTTRQSNVFTALVLFGERRSMYYVAIARDQARLVHGICGLRNTRFKHVLPRATRGAVRRALSSVTTQ